jgi:hypothetical protein
MFDRLKNILLSRGIQARLLQPSEVTEATDTDWQKHVALEIGLHTELSESPSKLIALENGMCGGKFEIKVRRALLCYEIKRLGPDTDPSAPRPKGRQIVLINSDEIRGGRP